MNEEQKKYFKLFLVMAGAFTVGIVIYFIIYRFNGLLKVIDLFSAILKPFFYGAVIAYLHVPICRKLEVRFDKLFKSKHKNISQGIAVISSILIGLLIVTAIVLLIIPVTRSTIDNPIVCILGRTLLLIISSKLSDISRIHFSIVSRITGSLFSSSLRTTIAFWILPGRE